MLQSTIGALLPLFSDREFNFKKEVEIVVTENGVLLRNPKYKLVKIESLDTDN